MPLPSPDTLGMPSKFNSWREHQSEACESIAACPTRFQLQICPTGFGKSLTYMASTVFFAGRTVVLTSTKGLQAQLLRDFGEVQGVVEIKGRGNYACRLNSKVNCDAGLCQFGVRCTMKDEGGCFYYDQLKRARYAKIVITNYAYWMAQNEFSDGLGRFELLVLDEAHSAVDHVIDHISVQLYKGSRIERRLLGLSSGLPESADDWVDWASERLEYAIAERENAKAKRKEKEYLQLKNLVAKLERLANRIDGTWVWEDSADSVTLSPIWPMPYSETVLFMGIPRVVLTSATAVPKTAQLLGIEDNLKHEEYPHSFALENRTLYHVPTVRLNYKNTDDDNRKWLDQLDRIISKRSGRKGIVHTVSYARRDMVLESSKFRGYMMTHDRPDTASVVRAFKNARAPCILVSPSMITGWDFPDDECRWQVIIKLPYPNTQGTIIRARNRADPEFTNYMVIQQLIQACGRGVRSEDDWCESFILDDNVVWFVDRNKHLMVDWFHEAFVSRIALPEPRR